MRLRIMLGLLASCFAAAVLTVTAASVRPCENGGRAELVLGAVPKIVGKEKWPAFTLVRLSADGLDEKAGILWRVYPAVDRASTGRGVLEFVGRPGDYRVELLAISQKDGVIDVKEAFKNITISSPDGEKPAPPKENANPRAALGRILFGNAGCTATVIGPRRGDGRWDVLTASHCVGGVGSTGVFTTSDGRKVPVRCTAYAKKSDLAWLVTDVVESLPFARLAKVNPAPGTKIWHAGFGVHNPGNVEKGEVSGSNPDGMLAMRLSVSSGDSGGGIFREDTGEVISAVCCTQARNTFTTMYGGSCETAWKLRPHVAELDAEEWKPVEIPLVESQTGCCGIFFSVYPR